MKKSILVKPKRGRPPSGGRDPFVGVRLAENLITEIDAWAADNDLPSRSEAIRRLVELGLKAKRASK
jgi:Arc/MetJ-type ribon-helix-helix transcriptional regulator